MSFPYLSIRNQASPLRIPGSISTTPRDNSLRMAVSNLHTTEYWHPASTSLTDRRISAVLLDQPFLPTSSFPSASRPRPPPPTALDHTKYVGKSAGHQVRASWAPSRSFPSHAFEAPRLLECFDADSVSTPRLSQDDVKFSEDGERVIEGADVD